MENRSAFSMMGRRRRNRVSIVGTDKTFLFPALRQDGSLCPDSSSGSSGYAFLRIIVA